MSTKIEWCNETWNPIIGCSKISDGCTNCYAEKMAVRLANIRTTNYYQAVTCKHAHSEPSGWNGKTFFQKSQLEKPFKWKKPRRIFVCSMGDLFHELVQVSWMDTVWDIMSNCQQHTFLILTKRPEIMAAFMDEVGSSKYGTLSNVWLGVTAENQEQADKRIPILLDIPAAKRFVSIEPMLGPVNFNINDGVGLNYDYIKGEAYSLGEKYYGGSKLDWVICGGESGHKARPMHPEWVRSIRDQCQEVGTPFLFKQWGEWIPRYYLDNKGEGPFINLTPDKNEVLLTDPILTNMVKVGKKKAGRELDGRTWDEYPE